MRVKWASLLPQLESSSGPQHPRAGPRPWCHVTPLVMPPEKLKHGWTMYKKDQASIWTAEVLVDRSHYQELSADEQKFLLHILAFFMTSVPMRPSSQLCRSGPITLSPMFVWPPDCH
jgi:hypothetical protein